jgi:hypothetical protein
MRYVVIFISVIFLACSEDNTYLLSDCPCDTLPATDPQREVMFGISQDTLYASVFEHILKPPIIGDSASLAVYFNTDCKDSPSLLETSEFYQVISGSYKATFRIGLDKIQPDDFSIKGVWVVLDPDISTASTIWTDCKNVTAKRRELQ